MKITKATVVVGGVGSDKVILEVADLKDAVWPFDGPLTLQFDAAKDTGEGYVKTHFPGVPVEKVG